jgi:tyrosyl-tRNA synthetase
VARFHGEDAAREAEAAFDRVFVRRAAPESVEEADLPDDALIHLPRLLEDLFGLSRSESRRLIEAGGVRLDGVPLPAGRLDLPAEELAGAVLQVGKRRFRRLRAAPGRAAPQPTAT